TQTDASVLRTDETLLPPTPPREDAGNDEFPDIPEMDATQMPPPWSPSQPLPGLDECFGEESSPAPAWSPVVWATNAYAIACSVVNSVHDKTSPMVIIRPDITIGEVDDESHHATEMFRSVLRR